MQGDNIIGVVNSSGMCAHLWHSTGYKMLICLAQWQRRKRTEGIGLCRETLEPGLEGLVLCSLVRVRITDEPLKEM